MVMAFSTNYQTFLVLRNRVLMIAGRNSNKKQILRLDNTGAWAIEVYPSLLCNWVSEKVDLYIKLKLGMFSFI